MDRWFVWTSGCGCGLVGVIVGVWLGGGVNRWE